MYLNEIMKHVLLLFLLLFGNLLYADEFEKNYGNGVVHINPDSIFHIEFYSSPNGEVTHLLTVTHNAWSLGRTMVTFDKMIDSFPQWFATEFFITNGEYSRLDIKAIDSVSGFYRTTLRDTANREVWIKKQKHVSFLSWLGFYNTVATIELNEGDLILYDKPDAKSKRVNYTPMMSADDRGYMRALEIKGQWMKVELQIPEHDPLMSWKTYTGWVRWRDDKQPLIKYNLMGC